MMTVSRVSLCLPILCALFASSVLADDDNTVTVNGLGVASIKPNLARVQMAIVEVDATPAVAQQAAAEVAERVLALTDQLAIDRSLVNTTGANVRPNYQWDKENRKQDIIGYIVTRNIEVEVRDLDKLGELIEGAVAAGVNTLQPPVLDSTERRATYRKALALAAEDARANAETLAAALNAELDEVIELNAADVMMVPRMMKGMQSEAQMASASGETYNSGDIRFEARLTAVFELKTR
ncbi:MAG: SIMPL domain-containing protein [Gammaproteobacteria bacterium]